MPISSYAVLSVTKGPRVGTVPLPRVTPDAPDTRYRFGLRFSPQGTQGCSKQPRYASPIPLQAFKHPYLTSVDLTGRNSSTRTALDELRARDQREPKNNREILYGLLPIPGGSDNGVAFTKRSKGAKSRQLHSKIDETTGETQRLTPCVHCAFQLVNWEGPEEGPRPLCVNRASGAQRCSRCFANKRGCVEVPATALEEVKAMEEKAKRTSTDDDLVGFLLGRLTLIQLTDVARPS